MITPSDLRERAARKTRFHDAHDRRAFARALEIATRLLEDPSLLGQGSTYLDRFVRSDPRQARAYDLWRGLLAEGAEHVALALIADDERGAYLRETAPVFTTIEGQGRGRLVNISE
ncbi:hypothetical protein [uncultured Caulobacter sp.]|uniref:hypothetical protein n=1 Tax=uncultured Caulobacter sp. TaxID=158749 RepID=UPI002602CA1F|nr:hypothetical protein [uncultured Caulobacter sp.]